MYFNKYGLKVYLKYIPGSVIKETAKVIIDFLRALIVRSFLSIEGGKYYG